MNNLDIKPPLKHFYEHGKVIYYSISLAAGLNINVKEVIHYFNLTDLRNLSE